MEGVNIKLGLHHNLLEMEGHDHVLPISTVYVLHTPTEFGVHTHNLDTVQVIHAYLSTAQHPGEQRNTQLVHP